jgi:hypothetical protein
MKMLRQPIPRLRIEEAQSTRFWSLHGYLLVFRRSAPDHARGCSL